jgi:predicted kinase
VPFSILHCDAPPDVLRARLAARRGDASEADIGVLDQLMKIAEPLAADELAFVTDARD